MFELLANLLRGHGETSRWLTRHILKLEKLMSDVVNRLAAVEVKLDGYATVARDTVKFLADLRDLLNQDSPDVVNALNSLDAHIASTDAAMSALTEAEAPPAQPPV